MGKLPHASFAIAAAATVALGACGGSNPTSPSPGGGGGTIAATITITTSGVTNRDVTVPVGSRVTFTNNDTRGHQMNSDPHPTHGDCPGIDSGVGFIAAGQSRTSDNLSVARTCGYHDHNDPDNASLKGVIRVQ